MSDAKPCPGCRSCMVAGVRHSRDERCRDCGVAVTADNVWEPGTCLDCARKLTPGDLHAAMTPAERNTATEQLVTLARTRSLSFDPCGCSAHHDTHRADCPTRAHVERPTRLAGGKTYCACGAPWPCPRLPAATDG